MKDFSKAVEGNSEEVKLPEYSEPVCKLLLHGAVELSTMTDDWPNYVEEYGLTQEDIPQLIRMISDDVLHTLPSEHVAVFAPVHAWRALGQLEAVNAIKPLLTSVAEKLEAAKMSNSRSFTI